MFITKSNPFFILTATNKDAGFKYRICYQCFIGKNVFHHKQAVIQLLGKDQVLKEEKKFSAKIKHVSQLGIMTIEFSELMNTNSSMKFINETYIDVFVTPLEEGESRQLNLTWELIKFVNKTLKI